MTDALYELAAVQTGPTHHPSYATPAFRPARVPSYAGITVGAVLLILFGVGFLAVAGLSAVVLFGGAARVAGEGNSGVAAVLASGGAVYTAGVAAWGLMLVMSGTLALAVRDIARNSFRR